MIGSREIGRYDFGEWRALPGLWIILIVENFQRKGKYVVLRQAL